MLNTIKKNVIKMMISVSFQRYFNPTPFSIMSLMMMINHFEGMILLRICITLGIFSIGKMKPESKIVGSIRPAREIIRAICWFLLTVEIKIPIDSAMKMKSKVSSSKRARLPLIGIPKTKYPNRRIEMALISERTT